MGRSKPPTSDSIHVQLWLHDGGHGWGGLFNIIAEPHWTAKYLRSQLHMIHGPLPHRLFFYRENNQAFGLGTTVAEILSPIAPDSPREIYLQCIYNANLQLPDGFVCGDPYLSLEFKWGDELPRCFPDASPPFQRRSKLEIQNGVPVVDFELEILLDGASSSGNIDHFCSSIIHHSSSITSSIIH
jgi:hypothetical protein